MRILKIIFGLACIAAAVPVGFAGLAIFSSWGGTIGYTSLILYACGLVLACWFVSQHRKDAMIAKHKKIIVASAGVLLVLVVAALIKFGGQERTVVGDYRLEQFEDFETYYLHKRGQDDSLQGGSFIGGIVLRIGWSSRYVVVERRSFYRGDPDGWMVIDVKTGDMTGPFTEADFKARQESQGIQIYGAAEAWKRL
jgi:hypothetical protein